MNTDLKSAIKRLREGNYINRVGQVAAIVRQRQDILAVCDALEQANIARDFSDAACDRQQQRA